MARRHLLSWLLYIMDITFVINITILLCLMNNSLQLEALGNRQSLPRHAALITDNFYNTVYPAVVEILYKKFWIRIVNQTIIKVDLVVAAARHSTAPEIS